MAFSPGTASSISSPGPSGAGDIQVVRADLVAPIQYFDAEAFRTVNSNTTGAQSGNYWFNPNSFSNAREVALNQEATAVNPATLLSQFTYGTFGRNSLRGPGAFNTNLSLSKVFRLREKRSWNCASMLSTCSTTWNSATPTPTSATRVSARSPIRPTRASFKWRCT